MFLKSLKIGDHIMSGTNTDGESTANELLKTVNSKLRNFQNLENLHMTNTALKTFPNLSSMQHLEVVNFSRNYISFINFNHLPTSSLKEFNVSENPIDEFNSEFCQFKSLRKLTIGSPETKYLAFPFLEKFAAILQLHVSCKDSLVYPSYNTVCCEDELQGFLYEKTLNLKTIVNSEEKLKAFDWILNRSGFRFNCLHLSGEKLLLEKAMSFFSYLSLKNVREMCVDCCSLEQIPDMSSLKQLSVLHIRNNYLYEINCDALPSSLQEIGLSDNPIAVISVDFSLLRKLKLIDCGSENTHYISFPILEKVHSRSIKLVLSDRHRQNLHMPPGRLFCDKDGISNYIKYPEKYLYLISDQATRKQALQWLFDESEYQFETIEFHPQTWLFCGGMEWACVHLKNTVKLILSRCDLEDLPAFDSLQNLKQLDLKLNRLRSLVTNQVFSSLETLDVTDNPLKELDFDNDTFPKLNLVSFGSDETWLISARILMRYSAGGLKLFVPGDHRKSLVFPLWTTLEKGEDSVGKFLRYPKLGLSGRKKLCENIGMEGLSSLFNHQSVKTVCYIDISECDLDEIPEWTRLTSLTKVNISGNKISRIPLSESLIEIDLTNTNISILALEEENYPCLRKVIAGSEHLQFISFDTLTRTSVDIPKPCSALIMPPRFVFSGADRLQHYKIEPEIFLRHVDNDKLTKAVDWLLNESNFKFTSLDFSTQRRTIESLDRESFKNIFHGTKLKYVTSLNLNECGLAEMPSVESLEKLETLQISKNLVTCLSKLKNNHLKQIDVTENPIETIDIDFASCPEIVQIHAGSLETKCLSVKVLERISEGKLIIHLVEKYKHLVVLPPPHIVKKGLQPEEVGKYLKDGLFDISWYFARERCVGALGNLVDEVKDILSLDKRTITSFTADHFSDLQDVVNEAILPDIESLNLCDSNMKSLSKFSHFDQLIQLNVSENPMEIEDYPIELPYLSFLNLAECGINAIPNLSRMPHLKELILSRNNISSLITLEIKRLESLHIDDNPLLVLDLDVDKVPRLMYIKFGSETCQFVDFTILEKIASGKINVDLCSDHASSLLVPLPDLFKDVQRLSSYIQCLQIDMSMFNTKSPEKKLECFKWMTKHRSIHTSILNLADEASFCNCIDTPGLESLLCTFRSLTELVLSKCDLSTTPHILKLAQLQKLDLKCNFISKFPDNLPESLIDIDLQGNPIVGLHFEKERLPNLKILRFGSAETKYISEHIIRLTIDGTLNLILEAENTQQLIFPPGNMVNDSLSLKQFMANASLNLASVPHCEWAVTLSWVQTYYPSVLKILKAYSKIDKIVCDLILYKTKFTKFTNLKELWINGLHLQYLPDLAALDSLTVLNCSENKMESLDLSKLPINSLRNLDISMNPILECNNDLNRLQKLLKLRLGSPQTRYICYPLLERSLSHLELIVHETCQNSLLYPSFGTVTEKDTLREFVKRRELNLECFSGPLKLDTLDWLLKRCGVSFKTLSLVKQKYFLTEANLSLLQIIQSHSGDCLEEVIEINVSGCGLTEIPDMSSLKKLKMIDLSNNEIQQINDNFLPLSIEKIDLEDNPIHCVAIDCQRLQELNQVRCGSKYTYSVSFPLLEHVVEGSMEMTVPQKYQEYLLIPPYALLKDHSALRRYIKHPENSLIEITDIEKRLRSLNWLLSSSKQDLKFDFSSHTWLTETNIVLSGISLRNVHTLILTKCDFYEFPRFSGMSALVHLDLSYNNLNTISFKELTLLQILNVAENPLNEIDFETEEAPSLKELSFGSAETKFISPRVLRLVKERKVALCIPEAHKNNLLFPPAIDLDNLEEYILCNTLGPEVITDPEKRLSVICWQLNQNENKFETLNASHLRNIDLSKIFYHCSLMSITKIDLSHCDLDHIPDWEMLKIETANISFNKLSDIPPNSFLETLDVSETMVSTLNLRRSDFPKLKYVIAGSHYLEYILFEVLKAFSLIILDRYKESIIMPPSLVLDSPEELEHYLKTPDKYINKVDGRKVSNAVMWLANDADFRFENVKFAGLKVLFKNSNIDLIWQGHNLSNITYLNIDNCELKVLPELQHLVHLVTLSLNENNLDNISTLKHNHLQQISLTENPIETISLNFKECPALKKISVGSTNTRVISLNVLNRILSHNFLIIVDDRYLEYVMLPPQHVVVSGFKKKAVKEYLNNGIFNVQWFVGKTEKLSAITADKLTQILSAEERPIDSFTMCDLPKLAQTVGDSIESLLEHKTLRNISHINLCHCQMAHTPPLRQLSRLTHVDISGNHIGNDLDKIGDTLSKYYVQSISVLKLRNTKLKRLPDIMNLPNLKVLDVSHNQIKSLMRLESDSLSYLNIAENKCPIFNLNPEKVPKLSKVLFGSPSSKYVTFSVLKTVVNGQMRLEIVEDHKTSLIVPPPSMLENTDELESYLRCKEISLNLFNTDDPEVQTKSIVWLIENENTGFKCLTLRGEARFCDSTKRLENLFSKMITVTKLTLSYCSLTTIPDVRDLVALRTLDLTYNDINTLDHLENAFVVDVRLQGNPIVGFDINNVSLPSLKRFSFGSSCTKYLSIETLKRAESGDFSLEITEDFAHYLVYPTAETIQNRTQIRNFVRNVSLHLDTLPECERKGAFDWILEHSSCKLKILSLSVSSARMFREKNEDPILETFELESYRLVNLSKLCMKELGLTVIPDLSCLKHLVELDFSFNQVTNIENVLFSDNVKILHTEGNPISDVSVSSINLSSLKEIYCGSSSDYSIAFPIIEKFTGRALKLHVVHDFLKNLLLPPPELIKSTENTAEGRSALQKYLKSPEKYLKQMVSRETKWKAFIWLISVSSREFEVLDFSGMAWIIDDSDVKLAQIFDKMTFSNCLKEVNLSNCNILKLKKLHFLPNIEKLNLSSNNLEKLSRVVMRQLKELNVSDNPIRIIDFDPECFPSLNCIIFGSEKSNSVSVRVLKLCSNKGLQIHVDEEARKFLLLPQWDIVSKKKSIEKWIKDDQFSLSHLLSDSDKLQALELTVAQRQKLYTSINLNNEGSLLKKISSTMRRELFASPVFKNVTEAYFCSCELDNINFLHVLKNLEILDVSDNKLSEIPECESLKSIDISKNNPLLDEHQALSVDIKRCPQLRHITAGSNNIKFVSFSIWETVNIEIIPPYDENILPPKNLFTVGTELKRYLKEPERFLTLSRYPDGFWWLLNHSDKRFIEINLSNQITSPNISPDCISDLFTSPNILSVQILSLENCCLSYIPNLEALVCLEKLDLNNNNIKDISSLKNPSLKSISILNNPVIQISLKEGNCKSINEVYCGSDLTKFIDIYTLRLFVQGSLQIKVAENYVDNILIPPEGMILSKNDVDLYIRSETFNLKFYANICKNGENAAKVLLEVLDHEERKLKSFQMSQQSKIYVQVGADGFDKILRHKALCDTEKIFVDYCKLPEIPETTSLCKLRQLNLCGNPGILSGQFGITSKVHHMLRELCISECAIQQMPSLPDNLETLDISYNNLNSIKVKYTHQTLKYINVADNPISDLEIEANSFPSLERIKFGSEELLYIGFNLLKYLCDNSCCIETTDCPNILFPPKSVFEGNLKDFVRQPYDYIKFVKPVDQWQKAMIWMLQNYNEKFTAFSFNYFENTKMQFSSKDYSGLINDYKCLHSVTILDLSNCKLSECPDLRCLSTLLELNLENNGIANIDILENCTHLQKLFLANNPLEAVSLDITSLTKITVGSEKTKLIGHRLLKAKSKGRLVIEISEPHQQVLIYPNCEVFRDSKKLKLFLQYPVQDLFKIQDSLERKLALVWTVTTNQYDFPRLDLSNQQCIFDELSVEFLHSFLSSKCLQNMTSFSLRNCAVAKIPKFDTKRLDVLDLSYNELTTIELKSEFGSLKELYLTGNPLERIEFDISSFPHLKKLGCGSRNTKYISIPILKRVIQGLKLIVPNNFRTSLLVPSYDIIEGHPSNLVKFIQNPEEYIPSKISDLNDKKNIIMWYFNNKESQHSFGLDNQKYLNAILEPLLHESSLVKIEILSLKGGDMTILPQLKHLENLKNLNISYNHISNINYDHIPSSIETVNIEGNPIKTLCVQETVLAEWEASGVRKNIQCGSSHMRFISFGITRLHYENFVHINVGRLFQNRLLMPSYNTLTSANLSDYLSNPDNYLNEICNSHEMREILEFLFKSERWKFKSKFSLSNPVCSDLDLCTYFSNESFKMVHYISITNCRLSTLQGLTNIPNIYSHLVTLDISGNNITDIRSMLCKLSLLEYLKIDNNPIEIVDFDFQNVQALKHLVFGSKWTKCVKYSLLKVMVKKCVNLEISHDASNLIFPGEYYIKEGNEALKMLCENPELGLGKMGDKDKKIEYLNWLYEEVDKDELKSFRLCKQSDLVESSKNILNNWKLSGITVLELIACKCVQFPDLEHFPTLQVLNLSLNLITEIPNHMTRHEKLTCLDLTDNPIETINSSLEYFPLLSKLKVGSKQTHFLGLPLLSKLIRSDESFSLHISKHHEEYIILPPTTLLKTKNMLTLQEYLKSPNIIKLINGISKIENKVKAVEWLSLYMYHTIEKFEMPRQAPICLALEEKGLQNILDKLTCVTEINLCSCELLYAPSIAALPKLTLLDLSYNNISRLDNKFSHSELKSLHLEGNPLTNISLDRFPRVKYLQCGSENIKSISVSTLKRIVSDKLHLEIPENYRGYLQLPKYNVIEGGLSAVETYLNEEVLDLSTVGTKEDVEMYCKNLKGREKQYKALRMSKASWKIEILQTDVFQDLVRTLQSTEKLYLPECEVDSSSIFFSFPNLTHIELSNSNLKNKVIANLPNTVNSLVARNCNLTELPHCFHVETLDLRNNGLAHLSSSEAFKQLKNLFIEENKLVIIEYDRHTFPLLKNLGCGSEECKFLSFRVVDEIILKKINFSMSPNILAKLSLPLRSDLSLQSLESYRKSPERHVQDLKSLKWLTDESAFKFLNLDLNDKTELYRELGFDQFQKFLGKKCFKDISELCLTGLELEETPTVQHLNSMKLLNLSNNNITKFDSTFSSNSLTNLNVVNNPISFLEFDLHKFPKLTYLEAGSQVTEGIARSILQVSKVLNGSLELQIPYNFTEFLKEPPYMTLENKNKLKKFLNIEERNFSKFERGDKMELTDIKKQLQSFTTDITKIILDGQTCISVGGKVTLECLLSELDLTGLTHLHLNSCSMYEFPNIEKLLNLVHLNLGGNYFANMEKVPFSCHEKLHTLILSDCNLFKMFDINYFPGLKHLNLSANKLRSIEKLNQIDGPFKTLEKLYIDGNPLDKIEIALEKFPTLNYIRIGSSCTKYVSFALLQKAGDGKLSIEVPKEYKRHLLLCPSKVLDGDAETIKKFLGSQEVDLSYILNDDERYRALLWLLDQREKNIKVLNFSGQESFLQKKAIDLCNLFDNPKLSNTEVVYLDHCNLPNIPLKSENLPNLKKLYLNDNKLTVIQNKHFKRHQNLEKVVLDGNPISIIHINDIRKNFPKLNTIQAGSEVTHNLSPTILEAVVNEKNPLNIHIVKKYGNLMRIPPYGILERGRDNVKIYLDTKYQKTTDSKFDMMKNTTRNILMLLGQPMAGKTSLLSTLREDEVVFTPEYDRTILLERSNLKLRKNTVISTYDFGAQETYEIEYPIFLRSKNVIALIVIDLNEYESSTHDVLVTKWLVNCVLCADCKVTFVPTKSEMLDSDEVSLKCKELRHNIIQYIGDEIALLNDLKEELEKPSRGSGEEDLRKINKSLNFFRALIQDIPVVPTSAYIKAGLEDLKKEIATKIDETENTITPEIYSKIMECIIEISEKQQYYIPFGEIKTRYTNDLALGTEEKNQDDMIRLCLDHYRKKGWILWYNECEEYIYTNVDNILKLHRKLYQHDLEEVLNYDIKFRQIIGDEILFTDKRKLLLRHGLMYTEMLKCIWEQFKLSNDEIDAMINLLTANDHCYIDYCGKTGEPLYRFPWFVREELEGSFWKNNWSKKLPSDTIEFNLKYKFLRRIPASLYERISVRLYNVNKKHGFHREDWKDGVYMAIGHLKLLVQKESNLKDPEISVKFRGPPSKIIELWEWCRFIYNNVLKILIETDTIITFNKVFVCPHCILNGCTFEESITYYLGTIMESKYDGKTANELCGRQPIPSAYLYPPVPDEEQKHWNRQNYIDSVIDDVRHTQRENTTTTGDITEETLIDVSKYIENEEIMTRLGVKGLHLPMNEINTYLTNNPRNIRKAATDMLFAWFKRSRPHNSNDEIREHLIKAFESAELSYVVADNERWFCKIQHTPSDTKVSCKPEHVKKNESGHKVYVDGKSSADIEKQAQQKVSPDGRLSTKIKEQTGNSPSLKLEQYPEGKKLSQDISRDQFVKMQPFESEQEVSLENKTLPESKDSAENRTSPESEQCKGSLGDKTLPQVKSKEVTNSLSAVTEQAKSTSLNMLEQQESSNGKLLPKTKEQTENGPPFQPQWYQDNKRYYEDQSVNRKSFESKEKISSGSKILPKANDQTENGESSKSEQHKISSDDKTLPEDKNKDVLNLSSEVTEQTEKTPLNVSEQHYFSGDRLTSKPEEQVGNEPLFQSEYEVSQDDKILPNIKNQSENMELFKSKQEVFLASKTLPETIDQTEKNKSSESEQCKAVQSAKHQVTAQTENTLANVLEQQESVDGKLLPKTVEQEKNGPPF